MPTSSRRPARRATLASISRKKSEGKNAAKSGARTPSAALVKRATAAADAKRNRLHAEAGELLALIKRRKQEIGDAFYDIGEALARLGQKDMIGVLGRKSFAEVCEKDAGVSASTGRRLVEVFTSMTRDQAIGMGSKKAMAMVALAAATPDADTAAGLYRKKSVALPGGRKIAPRSASANAIEEAATTLRHQRAAASAAAGKKPRGRTTTEAERKLAAVLEKRLHKLGIDRARVTAVATLSGQGADLRFEHIPAARIDDLRKAIRV